MDILLATDGSENARQALKLAAELASRMNGMLSILTVINPVPSEDLKRLAYMERVSSGEMAAIDAENILKEARMAASDLAAKIGKCHSLVGDPAEVIFEVIAEQRPDMVVVGRRGRGRLTGLLLGSVSQKLASLCPCPIVIVPNKAS